MGETVIPLADLRYAAPVPAIPLQPIAATGWLPDGLGRPLRDLRISVTDRCNFRCSYCMPKDVFDRDYVFLPQTSLLSFEEITRLARVFVAHGVQKIRLTGGEPLLRKGLENLIAQLAGLRTPDGAPLDITLTTNGSVLARKAAALQAAGLQRVTVSLDGLDDAIFRRMNDVDFPVAEVLAGIEAAHAAGLGPIKVNMVVKRGTNEQEILPMARYFRDHFDGRIVLRFIEYMDVGASNGWRMDEVLPSADVLKILQAEWPLEPLSPTVTGETAERWRYADGRGEIGLISSVTQAFCRVCHPRPRPAHPAAQRRQRCRHHQCIGRCVGRAGRPLFGTARRSGSRYLNRRAPCRDALHRRVDEPTPEAPSARPLKGAPPVARRSRIHGVCLRIG
jgi:cyclic pyranopterin phosphate synthase